MYQSGDSMFFDEWRLDKMCMRRSLVKLYLFLLNFGTLTNKCLVYLYTKSEDKPMYQSGDSMFFDEWRLDKMCMRRSLVKLYLFLLNFGTLTNKCLVYLYTKSEDKPMYQSGDSMFFDEWRLDKMCMRRSLVKPSLFLLNFGTLTNQCLVYLYTKSEEKPVYHSGDSIFFDEWRLDDMWGARWLNFICFFWILEH